MVRSPPVPVRAASPEAESSPGAIPEEGEDLLAEMYANPSSATKQNTTDLNPPPIPEERPEYDDTQADETYSTLFGIDGAFDYAEEEATFFDVLEKEGDDLKPSTDPLPPEKSSRVFWAILILSIIILIIIVSQDRVKPLEVTERKRNYLQWHKILLEDRPSTYHTKPVDLPWMIEIKPDLLKFQDPHQKVKKKTGKTGTVPIIPVKKRRLTTKEKRRLSSLIKDALKMKSSRETGEIERAIHLTNQALGLQPTDPDALLLAASLNMNLGKNLAALHHLQVLVQTTPHHNNASIVGSGYGPGIVYLLIGSTLQQLKLDRDALKYYEAYLREFPDSPQSREMRSIVRRIRNSPK